MNRRNFIQTGVLGLGGFSLGCSSSYNLSTALFETNNFIYLLGRSVDPAVVQMPDNMRVPFNWNSVGLNKDILVFKFNKSSTQKIGAAFFRISIAIDVREEKLVEVFLPETNRKLGILDIRYSPVFQPFELALSAKDVGEIFEHGIALKQLRGNSPLWIFQPGDTADLSNKGLMPHLLFFQENAKAIDLFYANFLSLNVVQSFGWMEGCVLDGLMDLNKRIPEKVSKEHFEEHLNLFFDRQQNLSYEGPFSRPHFNTFYGIESILPFASIAQIYPNHSLLPAVAKYCISKKDADGVIREQHVTTEGCYTIAYPLAAIAIALQQKQMAAIAIHQLISRKNLLMVNGSIHQKMDENKQLSYPNWARGVAWYLLGMVRTLSILNANKDIIQGMTTEMDTLTEEFIRAAHWTARLQDSSGLWFCFLDKPETGIDTSGSAGIAAALSIGASKGYLSPVYNRCSKRALKGLLNYITPDGFLSGAAQANKGGISLQQNGYRVISQYSSGLMAQLIASTSK